MKPALTWRCGHPRTPENTVGQGKGQCRECNRWHNRESYRRMTPAERFAKYRRRELPKQIMATELKLKMLLREADRLGVQYILENPDAINRAWEREITVARLESGQA